MLRLWGLLGWDEWMYFVGRKDTNFQRPGAKSYRLKVWIPTKINMLKSHPQCDGIRSWECPEAGRVGEAFMNGVVCVCVCVWVSRSCQTLQPHGLWPTRLLCLWDSPGKKTGVGCRFLLGWMGLAPYKADTRQLPHPMVTWGHSERMVYKPGRGLHQTLSLLALRSWTSQPPQVWKINFCCLKAGHGDWHICTSIYKIGN